MKSTVKRTVANQNGQMVIGLVLIIGLVSFILLQNIQTQQNFLVKKILETQIRADLETSVAEFGAQLYKGYVMASPIPESVDSVSRKIKTTTDPRTTLDFYIQGNEICYARQLYGATSPICIKLPDDFALRAEAHYQERFAGISFRNLIGLNWAEAQAFKNYSAEPTVSLTPESNIVRAFDSTFTSQYTRYNCKSTPPELRCLHLRICLKGNRSCASNAEKVEQTFILTLAPTTLQRN